MRVEFHDRLGQLTNRPASRVVIYDESGNALATFLQIDNNNIDVRVRGQAGFDEALRYLGIQQTVILTTVPVKTLPPLQVD